MGFDIREAGRRALVRAEDRWGPIEARAFNLELRSGGASAPVFHGIASTTEDPYEMEDWAGPYTEVIRSGAFTKTLQENQDIFFLAFHDPSRPIAGVCNGSLRLAEIADGLDVEADLDLRDPDAAAIEAKVASGLITKMSFGFQVVRQSWSPDWMQRDILEVRLLEVSVVTWPANPNTSAGMRHVPGTPKPTARLRAIQREIREGKTISAATAELLVGHLDSIAEASSTLADAKDELSDFLADNGIETGGFDNDGDIDVDDLTDDGTTVSDSDGVEPRGMSLALARSIAEADRLRTLQHK